MQDCHSQTPFKIPKTQIVLNFIISTKQTFSTAGELLKMLDRGAVKIPLYHNNLGLGLEYMGPSINNREGPFIWLEMFDICGCLVQAPLETN